MSSNERVIRKSIFEMRYEPQPHFFDRRGSILEQLFRDSPSDKPNFTHWQLRDNRVDVFEPEYDRICFVSFRNSGYQIEYQPSGNYFRDQLGKYMRVPLDHLRPSRLLRVGIRLGFVHPVRSFDETVKQIVRALYRTDDTRFVDLTKDLVDVQAIPFVCKEGAYAYTITSGAMRQVEYEQKKFFNKTDGLPEHSMWVDIDYAATDLDLGKDPHRRVMEFVEHAEQRVVQKHDLLVSMTLEGSNSGGR